MKSHRKVIGLLVLLFLACIGAVALWQHLHRSYPITTETESAFLKSYTPEKVTKPPLIENWGYSTGHGMSAGAGRDSVSHKGFFESQVVLRPEQWEPLMNALRDDASRQLANSGAEVLSQGGDPRDGFHFDYKLGRSSGSLTISPLKPNAGVQRNHSLPKGMEDVTVRIEQTERWFPKATGTIRTSATNVVQ
jgi:hypothetical protein